MDRKKALREYARRKAEEAMDVNCRRHLGISLSEFYELSEGEREELFIEAEVASFRKDLDGFA